MMSKSDVREETQDEIIHRNKVNQKIEEAKLIQQRPESAEKEEAKNAIYK